MKKIILLLSLLTISFSTKAQWELHGHVTIKNYKYGSFHTRIQTINVKEKVQDTSINKVFIKKGSKVKCERQLENCLYNESTCNNCIIKSKIKSIYPRPKCDCSNCVIIYYDSVYRDTCIYDTIITWKYIYYTLNLPRDSTFYATIGTLNDTIFINPWINNPYYNFPNREYFLLIPNRGYYNFKYSKNVFLAPVILPYKYRFALKHKSNGDFQALDGGGFIPFGRTWGSMVARYSKFENNDLYTKTFTTGPYIGFSVITMDANNNSRIRNGPPPANYPVVQSNESINVLALNMGWALFYNYGSLQLGLVAGLDHAIGPYGGNWAYQSVPWLAFGVGYNFDLLPVFAKN